MIGTEFDDRTRLRACLIAALLLVAGCAPAPTRPASGRNDSAPGDPSSAESTKSATSERNVRFEDLAALSGVAFTYHNGEEAGQFSILESLGGGLALWDYDNDGHLDLFFPGGGTLSDQRVAGLPGALFRNRGDWQFADETASSGLGERRFYSHGAAVGDFDNDGFSDLLVTGFGGLVLFRNCGDGTFLNESTSSGLNDSLWSTSAAWGDFNGDGALDLYVTHYVDWSFDNNPECTSQQSGRPRDVCPPPKFNPLPDTLYYSNGDGTFRDVSSEAGLRPDGKGLGVIAADLDLDSDLDLYVANDTSPNFLYRNQGGGRFDEDGLASGTSIDPSGLPNGSMGVDVGDYNRDGLPDIWVSNFERETNALYRNEGQGQFYHVSERTGVSAVGSVYVGWGSAFCDFDNDGDEDVVVSNGHVMRYSSFAPLRQVPLLFENRSGRFENVAPDAGDYLTSPHMGRGLAVGDLDGDGRVDVAVSHVNEPVSVLRNDSGGDSPGNWLGVRLIGTRGNRDAIGAIVRVKTEAGSQIRQRKGGGSYASTSSPILHFGLGEDRVIRSLEIVWPGGTKRSVSPGEVNQTLVVVE